MSVIKNVLLGILAATLLVLAGTYFIMFINGLSPLDNINPTKSSPVPTHLAPYPKDNAPIEINARAALVVFVDTQGSSTILMQKNKNEPGPIASMTKLMTALAALDLYQPTDLVEITSTAAQAKGKNDQYRAGQKFTLIELIHAMLVGSHNEAAVALSEKLGTEKFVTRMNEIASQLGLTNTRYFNPVGLDPAEFESTATSSDINRSTATDLVKIMQYIQEEHPDIFKILGQQEYIFKSDGDTIKAETTNRLLGDTELPFKLIAGKTGETPRAKKNLVFVTEAPGGGYIYGAVLNSSDQFADVRKVLEYVKDNFIW